MGLAPRCGQDCSPTESNLALKKQTRAICVLTLQNCFIISRLAAGYQHKIKCQTEQTYINGKHVLNLSNVGESCILSRGGGRFYLSLRECSLAISLLFCLSHSRRALSCSSRCLFLRSCSRSFSFTLACFPNDKDKRQGQNCYFLTLLCCVCMFMDAFCRKPDCRLAA